MPHGNRIDRLHNVHAHAKPRESSPSLPIFPSPRSESQRLRGRLRDLRRARDLRGGFYSRIADIRPAVADFSRHGTPPLPSPPLPSHPSLVNGAFLANEHAPACVPYGPPVRLVPLALPRPFSSLSLFLGCPFLSTPSRASHGDIRSVCLR